MGVSGDADRRPATGHRRLLLRWPRALPASSSAFATVPAPVVPIAVPNGTAPRTATIARATVGAPGTARRWSAPRRAAPWLSRVTGPAARVGRAFRRRPWLLTAALCAVSAGLGLTGPDTPAQEYRVWLFKHAGGTLWDDQWYGGHTVPGYSLLFPPLGALLGVTLVGIVSCVASTVIVTRLLRGRDGTGHDLALLWFATATVANLIVGRMPFALGMTFGALAVLGVRERRYKLAFAGAALSSLASPLAGGFVLMVACALGTSRDGNWRRALPLVGAVTGIGVSVAFPEQGTQPFPVGTFLSLLALIGVGLLVVPRQQRTVRRGLLLWAAAATVFFVVPTQVGGNITRPATLVAGPVAAVLLARRPKVLAVVAIPLLAWQIGPVQGALAGYGDPSSSSAYYRGLLSYLAHGPVPAGQGRVEIPMTRSHWEARFVAPTVPLARGWERQLDMQYNGLFYNGTLTAATYHKWLLHRGIRYVALPNVVLDSSAQQEAKLLATNLPYLRRAWSDQNWTVWLVTDSPGLVSGPAQLTELGVNTLGVDFTRPGVATVLVHYTPYWQLETGQACVFQAADGWTGILTSEAGPVRLEAKLSVNGLLARPRGLDCPTDSRVH
ncbi:MAG: hypothetical protein ACQSGP_12295 [Frankia sp.]